MSASSSALSRSLATVPPPLLAWAGCFDGWLAPFEVRVRAAKEASGPAAWLVVEVLDVLAGTLEFGADATGAIWVKKV